MTSSTNLQPQSPEPFSSRQNLPTMYDLPSENQEEPGKPDHFHFLQPLLLFLTFQPATIVPELVFSAVDLYLYYDVAHPLWYKRPDWFGAVGVHKLYKGEDLRLSYVTWDEPANPFVVVELLSPGTDKEDLGLVERKPEEPPTKWEVYEQILRIPYYFVFNRYTSELKAFHLVGDRYEPMPSNDGRWLIPELELSLGLWQGTYDGATRLWLRWMTIEGELIPISKEEIAEAKQETAEAKQEATETKQEAKQEIAEAQQEAAKAQQEVTLLREKLRQLGINPDEIAYPGNSSS